MLDPCRRAPHRRGVRRKARHCLTTPGHGRLRCRCQAAGSARSEVGEPPVAAGPPAGLATRRGAGARMTARPSPCEAPGTSLLERRRRRSRLTTRSRHLSCRNEGSKADIDTPLLPVLARRFERQCSGIAAGRCLLATSRCRPEVLGHAHLDCDRLRLSVVDRDCAIQ